MYFLVHRLTNILLDQELDFCSFQELDFCSFQEVGYFPDRYLSPNNAHQHMHLVFHLFYDKIRTSINYALSMQMISILTYVACCWLVD